MDHSHFNGATELPQRPEVLDRTLSQLLTQIFATDLYATQLEQVVRQLQSQLAEKDAAIQSLTARMQQANMEHAAEKLAAPSNFTIPFPADTAKHKGNHADHDNPR